MWDQGAVKKRLWTGWAKFFAEVDAELEPEPEPKLLMWW